MCLADQHKTACSYRKKLGFFGGGRGGGGGVFVCMCGVFFLGGGRGWMGDILDDI